MNYLLWIVIGIIVLCFIIGIIRGFVKMLFTAGALIVTILLAVALTNPTADFLKNHTGVYSWVYEKIDGYTEEKIDSKFNDYAPAQEGAIAKLPLPSIIKDSLNEHNNADTYKEMGVKSFSDYVATFLSNIVLKAIAFIVIFIIISILLRILLLILNMLTRLPVIHGANKFLGALFGLLLGLTIVWLICAFITMISATPLGQSLSQMINSSNLLSLIYNNNLLIDFLTNVVVNL